MNYYRFFFIICYFFHCFFFIFMDIENQNKEFNNNEGKKKKSLGTLCFMCFRLCYEILVLYFIYVLACIITLIFPCLLTFMFLKKKIKIASAHLKNIVLFVLTIVCIPLFYLFIAIFLVCYFIFILLCQFFHVFSKKRKTKISQEFNFEQEKDKLSEKELENKKLLDMQIEKPSNT